MRGGREGDAAASAIERRRQECACAAAPPLSSERTYRGMDDGGLRWGSTGLIGLAHLVFFLSNESPLKQFKWDGMVNPT